MSTQRPTTDLRLLDLQHPALARLSWDDRWAEAVLHRPERRREPRSGPVRSRASRRRARGRHLLVPVRPRPA